MLPEKLAHPFIQLVQGRGDDETEMSFLYTVPRGDPFDGEAHKIEPEQRFSALKLDGDVL
jgi:hypothetical protein